MAWRPLPHRVHSLLPPRVRRQSPLPLCEHMLRHAPICWPALRPPLRPSGARTKPHWAAAVPLAVVLARLPSEKHHGL
eukprot:1985868-Karenia_brevis.AAC.1